MKQNNIILNKTYAFSLRIIHLYKLLCKKKNLYEIAKQILKSGTSIGANSEEAIGAESRADFIHKFSIAYKEARETRYWLRLCKDSGLIDSKLAISLLDDAEEILAIIGKIKVTSSKHS